MIRKQQFANELPDLSGVAVWLSDRNVPPNRIADILRTRAGTVRVILHRERNRKGRRNAHLLTALDNRLHSTNRAAFPRAIRESLKKSGRSNILSIQFQVQEYADSFWSGVPFLSGLSELGAMLQKVSGPAGNNLPLLRVQARLHTLAAETYLHSGYAASALRVGLEAHGLWEWIFQRSSNALDLEQLAKTLLVISNGCISRRDMRRAHAWLELAEQAFRSSHSIRHLHPDPEYLRQRASIARGVGDIVDARRRLKQARAELPYTVPNPTKAQLNDMADRVLNVISDMPRWDDSRQLFEDALMSWSRFDSHRASNLLWTVSGGLQTDSSAIQNEALDLLEKYKSITEGFGLQSTGAFLLGLTPRVPKYLQKSWAMFAISYNAYSEK